MRTRDGSGCYPHTGVTDQTPGWSPPAVSCRCWRAVGTAYKSNTHSTPSAIEDPLNYGEEQKNCCALCFPVAVRILSNRTWPFKRLFILFFLSSSQQSTCSFELIRNKVSLLWSSPNNKVSPHNCPFSNLQMLKRPHSWHQCCWV